MFDWFRALGLEDVINAWRGGASLYRPPGWVLFYVPNGTWTYAFTSILTYLWIDTFSFIKYLAILFPVSMGLFLEIGQYINFIPGTYSHGDIIAHLLGAIIGFSLVKFIFKRRETHAF